jgi:anti-sigma factor RsiW
VARLDHLLLRRWLDAYVDAELDLERNERIGRHLTACPRCRQDIELTLRVKAVLVGR